MSDVVLLNPKEIEPPNEVYDFEKLAKLTQSMREVGWDGRPLYVVAKDDRRIGLTGSHRLAAAIEVGIKVPCIFIERSKENP